MISRKNKKIKIIIKKNKTLFKIKMNSSNKKTKRNRYQIIKIKII